MATLYVVVPGPCDGVGTASEDGSKVALSIADLRLLRARLQGSGQTLRQYLAAKHPVDVRTSVSTPPVADDLFGPLELPPAPVSEALAARRRYLQARQEERDYSRLVASVQEDVVAERNRESFALFHQQASVGVNLIASVLTAALLGYMVGRLWGNGNVSTRAVVPLGPSPLGLNLRPLTPAPAPLRFRGAGVAVRTRPRHRHALHRRRAHHPETHPTGQAAGAETEGVACAAAGCACGEPGTRGLPGSQAAG